MLMERCELRKSPAGSSNTLLQNSEWYALIVREDLVFLGSGSPQGLHAGLDTLEQLEVRPGNESHREFVQFPSLLIVDYPRLRWRAFHIDVARHFFPATDIIELMRQLRRVKINVLHVHMTDDQGWRFPVDLLPRLIEVGAWRRDNGRGDQEQYGGSYSFEELQSIVDAAEYLGMQILPEIDVPGHMGAALAAYPDLACPGTAPPHVPTRWGVLPYSLCLRTPAAFDRSLHFVYTVLEAVIGVFPGAFIHLGGDEVPGSVSDDDFINFFRALADFLEHRSKVAVVWDEVQAVFHRNGVSMPPNMVVEAWRSEASMARVARSGRPTIGAPMSRLYLNKRHISFDRVLGFDVEPCHQTRGPSVSGSAVIPKGASACLWTEYVADSQSLFRHAFPRAHAAAQAFWAGGAGHPIHASHHPPRATLVAASRRLCESTTCGEFVLDPSEVNAPCVFTSMVTYMDGKAPTFLGRAVDDNTSSFWWSEGSPSPGDHVTLLLAAHSPETCQVFALTGHGHGRGDVCAECILETSTSTSFPIVFNRVAKLENGAAKVALDDGLAVTAVRLRVLQAQRQWLVVRELGVAPCSATERQDEPGHRTKQRSEL